MTTIRKAKSSMTVNEKIYFLSVCLSLWLIGTVRAKPERLWAGPGFKVRSLGSVTR